MPTPAPYPPVAPPLGFGQFVWLWNRAQGRTTPDIHREMAGWLGRARSNRERRLLLMAFRDAGKSTVVGLYCAWLLACDPNARLLVLAAEGELARKMTRNVRGLIERHPACRHLIPDRPEQWAADRLTVRRPLVQRDPSLLARGIGANITGSRADVVICDDVEVPNTCDSAEKRRDLRDRLAEIAFVLVPGGLQLYVGTPHAYRSIYAEAADDEADEKTPFLDGFARLVLPVVDEAGRSRWPERFGPNEIEEIKRRTGPARFTSQMLLRPCPPEDVRLDPDRLVRYADDLQLRVGNGLAILSLGEQRMTAAACWWDPAFGRPGKGDASVVAVVFVDGEGAYRLHAVDYLTHDPAAETDPATQLCRRVAAFLETHHLPAVTVETNGIGRFLPALLRRELKAKGVAAAVLEHASTRAKDERILDAFDPLLAAGALRVHESVWRTPFVREMREWRPGGRSRDDGLDAVAGCLLAAPVRLGRPPTPAARPDWRPAGGAFRAGTDFRP